MEREIGQPPKDGERLDGRYVEIRQQGRTIDQGRVEVATDDGSILWFGMNGVSPRRLVEKLPGTEVRIISGADRGEAANNASC